MEIPPEDYKKLLDLIQTPHYNNILSDEETRNFLQEVFVNMTIFHIATAPNLEKACNFDIKKAVQRTVCRFLEAQAKGVSGEALSRLTWAPTQGT
jgi:hypothetical protein